MPEATRSLAPTWVPAPVGEITELVAAGLPERLAILLTRRGVDSPQAAERFLEPGLKGLHDPLLMPGLGAGIERLITALERQERVAIVGDYDVDGVSATALLKAVFSAVGLEAEAILPERLHEGYGFQPVHVDEALRLGCKLVVTADCGSTAVEAAERAHAEGLDVIVTDHHLGSEAQLPEGVIEINPHRADSEYPFPELSGAGVGYKLAVGLLRALGRDVEQEALLRMTCLGTICDLVPLLGENRVIAAIGLESLADTRSVGLQALMHKASVKPPVTAVDVGYRIGPRINAAGRLASPRPALELLLTREPGQARQLAEQLDSWNNDRQSTERRVVEEAEERIADLDELPPILVEWSEDWHPGVLGIAAGRIARSFHRPTLLLHDDGSVAKGSGRSVAGIHLFDFLAGWRSEYTRFGGHSQAIGISVPSDDLESLRQRWQGRAQQQWDPSSLIRTFEYELSLLPSETDSALLDELEKLEPCGMGNRQPVLRVGGLCLAAEPRRFGKGHLAARAIGAEGGEVELLGWGWQEREKDLAGTFEVLATLERDRYHKGPVLRLIDARPIATGSGSD